LARHTIVFLWFFCISFLSTLIHLRSKVENVRPEVEAAVPHPVVKVLAAVRLPTMMAWNPQEDSLTDRSNRFVLCYWTLYNETVFSSVMFK
jgi:hypothetical protein